MSFKTIAGRSDGVFWWFPELSKDQEQFCQIHQNYLVALILHIYVWVCLIVWLGWILCQKKSCMMGNCVYKVNYLNMEAHLLLFCKLRYTLSVWYLWDFPTTNYVPLGDGCIKIFWCKPRNFKIRWTIYIFLCRYFSLLWIKCTN